MDKQSTVWATNQRLIQWDNVYCLCSPVWKVWPTLLNIRDYRRLATGITDSYYWVCIIYVINGMTIIMIEYGTWHQYTCSRICEQAKCNNKWVTQLFPYSQSSLFISLYSGLMFLYWVTLIIKKWDCLGFGNSWVFHKMQNSQKNAKLCFSYDRFWLLKPVVYCYIFMLWM